MKGHIMRSLLLILVFALVSSQARTLTEDVGKLKGKYGRTATPPPAPYTAPPTKEAFPLLLQNLNNYGRNAPPSPPSPKPSTPIIQMIITSIQGDNAFGILKNYRRGMSPPPAPKLPPPIHEVSGLRVVSAAE